MDWSQWLVMLACDQLFEHHPLQRTLFEHTEHLANAVPIANLPAQIHAIGLSVHDLQQIVYRILTAQTIASATIPSANRRSTSYESEAPRTLEALLLEHAFMREHFTPQIVTFIQHLPSIDLSLLETGAQLETQYYGTLDARIMVLEKQHYYTVVSKRAAAAAANTSYEFDNIVEYFVSADGGNPLDGRLRLVMGEVLYTLSKHQFSSERPVNNNSVLFSSDSLCMHVGDILCVLIDTGIISVEDTTTSLLHVPHGLWHICRLAVNFPLLFEQIVAQVMRVLEAVAIQNKLNSSSSVPPLWSLVVFKLLQLRPTYLMCLLGQTLTKRSSLRDVFLLAEARCCDFITMPAEKSRLADSAGHFVLSFLKTLLAGVTQDSSGSLPGTKNSSLSNSGSRRPAGGTTLSSSSTSHHTQHVSKWVYSHWREQYRLFDTSFQQLRSMLTCYLAACVYHVENSTDDEAVLRLSPDLFTTYAAASCVYTLKWTDDEARLLLRLVSHKTASIGSPSHVTSAVAQQHIVFSLAIVLLGASERVFNDEDGMQTLKNWFRWLLTLDNDGQHPDTSNFNFADILLLFGTNFHSGQMETLSDLIQKILGFRLSAQIVTTSAHAARMARAFADEIFSDSVLAQHSARVSPTRALSAAVRSAGAGIVPAHCILQLVQAGVFNRVPYVVGGFSLKKWILRQIRYCTAPVHAVMIDLIEAYNQQCIFPSPSRSSGLTSRKNSMQERSSHTNGQQFVKFTESEICEIFTKNLDADDKMSEDDDDDSNYAALMLLQSSDSSNFEKTLNFFDFDADDDSSVVPRVLLLYAVLNFNDRATHWLWSTIKAGGKLPPPPRSIAAVGNKGIAAPYSLLLLQNLPIKLLLRRMEARRNELYSCVYAKMMRYVLQQLPHLCQVEDFLDEQQYFPNKVGVSNAQQRNAYEASSPAETEDDSQKVERLRNQIQSLLEKFDADRNEQIFRESFAEISQILRQLSLLRPEQLVSMQSNFLRLLPQLTENKSISASGADELRIEEFVKIILIKLNAVCPARLWCDLISLFMGKHPALWRVSRRTIDFEKICDEPLLIFQAFLSDSMLNEKNSSGIVVVLIEFSLRIFKCCLAAQQVQLTTHLLQTCYEKFQYAQEMAATQKNKSILASHQPEWPPSTGAQMLELTQKYTTKKLDAYLKLQSSAAVQCLLEFCQQILNSTKKNQNFRRRNVRILDVICNFLHQEFIHDAYVGKLVAFQGFQLELLPILVDRVPSFHICIDFIPELLGQWQLHKKVFAFHLLAHLACKYRVQKALNVAHMALDVANTMLVVCDSDERQRVFTSIAPCLVVLARLFVPLRPNAIELLQQLARMEQSMLAKQRLSFEGVSRRSLEADVDEPNGTFSSNEELLSSSSIIYSSANKNSKFDRGAVIRPLADLIVKLGVSNDENACK